MKNFVLGNTAILIVFLGMINTVRSQDCTTVNLIVTTSLSSCLTGDVANVNVLISEGVGPYVYSILDDQGLVRESANTTSNSYDFSASHFIYENGTYTVRVVDANNCVVEEDVEIELFLFPGVAYESLNVSCFGENDGEIRIQDNIGVGFLEYILTNLDDNTSITGTFNVPPYSFTGLKPGEYLLSLSDPFCSDQYITTISEPSALITAVTAVQDVSCLGDDGVINIESVGGTSPYLYSLSQEGTEIVVASTSNVFTDLSAGEYIVEVVDANSCFVNVLVVITAQEPLTSVVTKTDIICLADSGQIVVEALGGTPPYLYSLNNGSFLTTNIFTDLTSGAYTVNTLDSFGCSVINQITIEEPFPLLLSLEKEIDYISTSDNMIIVNPVGGILPFEYELVGTTIESIRNDTGVFNQIPEGGYTISVIDGAGCVIIETLIISYDDANSDGIADNDEDVNGNGELDDDDTDGDGVPDYLDDDDDNDGVNSAGEIDPSGKMFSKAANNFLDTDGDDIPNHRDTDDDGDGILTIDEDYNGNGDPTDDDTDNSGIADYLEIGVALSVQENELSNRFSFFPNPATSDIIVAFNTMGGAFLEVTFYNVNGRKMVTKKGVNTNESMKFDVSSFSTGMYFVQVYDGNNYGVKKLFVK